MKASPHDNMILQKDLMKYLCGDAICFTAKSLKTGKHYTYRLNRVYLISDRTSYQIVELLIGNDNESDYHIIGEIHQHGLSKKFLLQPDDIIHPWSRSVRAIKFVLYHSYAKRACHMLQIWNKSYCSICGRLLTHPDSIARHKGPICCNL